MKIAINMINYLIILIFVTTFAQAETVGYQPTRVAAHFINHESNATLDLKWGVSQYDLPQLRVRYRGKAIATFNNGYIHYLGTCVDEQSGLEQLVIEDGSGGTMDVGFFHYLYWDADYGEFAEAELDKETDEQDSEQGGHCLWNTRKQQRKEANAESGWTLFKQIRPLAKSVHLHAIGMKPIRLKTRRVSDSKVKSVQQRMQRLADERFSSQVVVSNANWEIIKMQFDQLCGSWGVVLARKPGAPDWISFYDVPAGCTFSGLGEVENQGIEGDIWHVSLSEDRSRDYYRMDLKNMTLAQELPQKNCNNSVR